MATLKRLISSVLLALGMLLVFFGFTQALGFTSGGMLASVAAIAALLYAGAVWVAPEPARGGTASQFPLVVFDRGGRIVSGAATGQPLASQFPEILRPEIERRSAAALAGTSSRFPCVLNGRPILIEALAVRSADGAVVYGILLTAESSPATVAATA